jgi:hypothetical protein
MARHARSINRANRLVALAVVTVVWVCGLGAGFYALLSIAARYGCGATNHGLGCGNAGSAVGVALLIGVIATVTSVTVLVHGRNPMRILVIGLVGLFALAGCAVGAHALLNTV